MLTRFMQRVFSAMSDGEDELLAQINNDVRDTERAGSKDTLQIRYVRMPDLVIKAMDNRTGEETLIKRSGSCMILRIGGDSFDPVKNRILGNVESDPIARLLPLFLCDRAPQVLKDKVFACFGSGSRESFNITPEQKRKLEEQREQKRRQVAKLNDQLAKLKDNPDNQVVTDYGISTDVGIRDKISELEAKRDLAKAGEDGLEAVIRHDHNAMRKATEASFNANTRLDSIDSNKERAKRAEDKQEEARKEFQRGSGADRYKGYAGRGVGRTKNPLGVSTRSYSTQDGELWSDEMGYSYLQKMFGIGQKVMDFFWGKPHYRKEGKYDWSSSTGRKPANVPTTGNGDTNTSGVGGNGGQNERENGSGSHGNDQNSQNGTQNNDRPLDAKNDSDRGHDEGSRQDRPAPSGNDRQIEALNRKMEDWMSRMETKIDGMVNSSSGKTQPDVQSQGQQTRSQGQGNGSDSSNDDNVDVSPGASAPGGGSGAQPPAPSNPQNRQDAQPPQNPQNPQPANPQNPQPANTAPAPLTSADKERMSREVDMMSMFKKAFGQDMAAKFDAINKNVAGKSDDAYWDMMNQKYGVRGGNSQQAENVRANIENVAKYRAAQFEGDKKDIEAFNQRMADVANAQRGDRQAMWNDPRAWHKSNMDYAQSLGRHIGQNVQAEYDPSDKTGSHARFFYVDSNGNKQYLSGPGYMPSANRDSVGTALSHHWNNAAWGAIDNTVEEAKNALWRAPADAYRNTSGNFFNKLGAAFGAFGNTSVATNRPAYSLPNNGVLPAPNNSTPAPNGAQTNSTPVATQQGQATPPNYLDSVLNRMESGSDAMTGRYADQRRIDANINDNDAFLNALQARTSAAQGRIGQAINTAQGDINQANQESNNLLMNRYDNTYNQLQQSIQGHNTATQGAFNQVLTSAQGNNNALQNIADKNEQNRALRNTINQMWAGTR